jgi:hypothetical protein
MEQRHIPAATAETSSTNKNTTTATRTCKKKA